jgi:hypothetical protein
MKDAGLLAAVAPWEAAPVQYQQDLLAKLH